MKHVCVIRVECDGKDCNNHVATFAEIEEVPEKVFEEVSQTWVDASELLENMAEWSRVSDGAMCTSCTLKKNMPSILIQRAETELYKASLSVSVSNNYFGMYAYSIELKDINGNIIGKHIDTFFDHIGNKQHYFSYRK